VNLSIFGTNRVSVRVLNYKLSDAKMYLASKAYNLIIFTLLKGISVVKIKNIKTYNNNIGYRCTISKNMHKKTTTLPYNL
jgi:hypothetical protein